MKMATMLILLLGASIGKACVPTPRSECGCEQEKKWPYITLKGPTYYISEIQVFRDEVDHVCNEVNGTTVEIASEIKFDSVTEAIVQWINQSPKVKQAFYDLRLNLRFWTSSAYDQETKEAVADEGKRGFLKWKEGRLHEKIYENGMNNRNSWTEINIIVNTKLDSPRIRSAMELSPAESLYFAICEFEY